MHCFVMFAKREKNCLINFAAGLTAAAFKNGGSVEAYMGLQRTDEGLDTQKYYQYSHEQHAEFRINFVAGVSADRRR